MIKVDNIETFGWEGAIRGMRMPMNSWDRSDSYRKPIVCHLETNTIGVSTECVIGANDLTLMKKLAKAGTEHRKFLRMIHIQMDITAPLYWWKEADQYRIAVTTNSTSTMHKIHAKEFTLDDFSYEHLIVGIYEDINHRLCVPPADTLNGIISQLNGFRELYIKTYDKLYWWQMIQLLPSSYNQKRTIDFNYETALNIIRQRTGHKLDEWNEFVDILKELPYMKELLEGDE